MVASPVIRKNLLRLWILRIGDHAVSLHDKVILSSSKPAVVLPAVVLPAVVLPPLAKQVAVQLPFRGGKKGEHLG